MNPFARLVLILGAYLAFLVVLAFVAAAFVTAIGGVGLALVYGVGAFSWKAIPAGICLAILPVVDVALGLLLACGSIRWLRESALNRKITVLSRKGDTARKAFWNRIERLHRLQYGAAWVMVAITLAAAGAAAWWGGVPLYANALVPLALGLSAVIAAGFQMLVNRAA